jgi:hypothetical protein
VVRQTAHHLAPRLSATARSRWRCAGTSGSADRTISVTRSALGGSIRSRWQRASRSPSRGPGPLGARTRPRARRASRPACPRRRHCNRESGVTADLASVPLSRPAVVVVRRRPGPLLCSWSTSGKSDPPLLGALAGRDRPCSSVGGCGPVGAQAVHRAGEDSAGALRGDTADLCCRDFTSQEPRLREFPAARAWTRPEWPTRLFDQAAAWLCAGRVLLPGVACWAGWSPRCKRRQVTGCTPQWPPRSKRRSSAAWTDCSWCLRPRAPQS